MTNLEKYNQAFIEALMVNENELTGLYYNSVPTWDSVAHMILISMIESTFGIEISPKDIMEFNSYCNGKQILSEKYHIEIK